MNIWTIISYDIETKLISDHHIPTHICYFFDTNGKIQSSQNCIELFLDDIIHSKTPVSRCYSHNFSRFDSYFIVPALKSKKIKITEMYIKNGNIFFVKCKINNCTIYFLDSAMYLSIPLKEIFKIYNWNKTFSIYLQKNNLLLYLLFDVIGLAYVLNLLQLWSKQVYKINMMCYISLPHYAYTVYLTRFKSSILYFLSNNLRKIFQPFFTGSKIQITTNRSKNLYFYDVNSMYPYMMLRPLPNKYCGVEKNCNLNTFFGFVFVSLVKKPKNLFYTDITTGIIFSEELKNLLILGHEFQFHQFIRFKQEYLFDTYVNHFYLIKSFTKSLFLKHVSKLFLNSLYGKFSTKASRNNALHISLAINSYARLEMCQYKMDVFVYADTDSIIYFWEIKNVYIGTNIGLLKLVDKIDEGYFLPNYYMYKADKKIIIKARGMIKKIFPIFTGSKYDFKLSYFKKKQYQIYLKETFFKFSYSPENVVYYPPKMVKDGRDWFGWFY